MNTKKPLVSVIVPVYNTEKYIRECLDSILAQTYTNLECLIIQDGSTDNSVEICREYARADARVRLYEQENRGLSTARNRGLDNMRGDYLTFVDADDCLSKNFLEITVKMMTENAADIVAVDDKKFKNETDRIIFEYIKVNGFITVHQVLDITRITTNQGANVALGRLINAGVVQKVRQGRHFIYQLK